MNVTPPPESTQSGNGVLRLRCEVEGRVQGVGFRPTVHRVAMAMKLGGSVSNTLNGALIEIEGAALHVRRFRAELEAALPPIAAIDLWHEREIEPRAERNFRIETSRAAGRPAAVVLPDLATCPDCLREILDPANRRHRYAFTNCTNCGPRFTIIHALPYDRSRTSMRGFTMCPACQREYDDPTDRRFHAQPNACPACGPRLTLTNPDGTVRCDEDEALIAAATALRDGAILALKGLGGYQLLVDAANDDAVRRLRERKHRYEKPLAVMVPDLTCAEALGTLTPPEIERLTSPVAPILIVPRRDGGPDIAASVAPLNPNLGLMLPTTPLHHLLLLAVDRPLVATSGNRSDEPIAIDADEAHARLAPIADLFLDHDRPIVRHADDSVLRFMGGKATVIRSARGLAPFPLRQNAPMPALLAVGAHQKNNVAITAGARMVVSQHIGDLTTTEACAAFERATNDLQSLYDVAPVAVACDLHPNYHSTQRAAALGPRVFAVQHHHAHVASAMAEHNLHGPVLGIAWDGTGWGPDGTIWGGEFLRCTRAAYERIAHLKPFPLAGGDQAVREPRRVALALLSLFDAADAPPIPAALTDAFTAAEMKTLGTMLDRGINCPMTSSAGRLFDGLAALLGVRFHVRHEGQAAMELEFMARPPADATPYPFRFDPAQRTLDWRPLVVAVLDDAARRSASPATIAWRIHRTFAEMMHHVARHAELERIVLTGGCFQNRLLTELTVDTLTAGGFDVYRHENVPPNDGGIALGQLVVAHALLENET